ncbi:putative nitrilase [Venturia nashicola]|uniref:nitrilase n=1 Tax=Venturia nashicola TaxID=86259 RepID=A0A4Z1NTK5_9PEZI|nr:putative nitrilase [Venturia nashicola]
MDRIRAAVKKAGIVVVLGYSERDGTSLYIAQSFIDTTGEILHHRRKIKPTHVERSIWGDARKDGESGEMNMAGFPLFKTPSGGFAQIFGPDGRPLAKALDAGDEGIVTAVIDLKDIDFAKAVIDTVGHYSRPDLLSLLVNPSAAKIVTHID